MIVLGASGVLVLATAVASTSEATPRGAQPAARAQSGDPIALAAVPQVAIDAATVSKVSLAGWSASGGRGAIVVPNVRQRIARVSASSSHDLPQAALDAYRNAERVLARTNPGCHLSWTLLAAIGQVESDNGRYGGAVVLANGDTSPRILGPVLNGTGGVGAIRDTDGGRYDGDTVWDRAVGPMQFIPGTWAAYGADGNGDGIRNPGNIADAALAAAGYLCAGGGDLRITGDARAAVMRYNHSVAYVDLVLSLARAYASGAATVIPNAHLVLHRQPIRHRDTTAPSKPRGDQPPGHRKTGHQGQHGGTGGGSGGGGGHGDGGKGGGGHGDGGQNQPPTTTSPTSPKPPTTTSPKRPTTTSPTSPKPPTTTSPTSPKPPTAPGRPKPPSADPAAPVATGVLSRCGSTWCVDTTELDFGVGVDLAARVGDLNADGKTRSLRRELRSLDGLATTVLIAVPEATPSAKAQPAKAPPTGPAPQDAAAETLVITVDAEGVVASINGLPYSAPPVTP